MIFFRMYHVIMVFLWVAGFQAVGALIGMMTHANIPDWYMHLNKSELTPPNMVFPIVWGVMYVLIALAGWRLFTLRDVHGGKLALGFYVIYVALNWGWSVIFFAMHQIEVGFYWALATALLNLAVAFSAWRVSKFAAALMVAPFLWTGFAAFLNYKIWVLN